MVNLNDAIKIAKEAILMAHSPYNKYYFGAALVCKNGKIYSGCNIDNHGILSICAERVAFTKAISEGNKDFDYIVICGVKEDINNIINGTPCGYCRQFMSEFVDKDFKVYTVGPNDQITSYTMQDLLPYNYSI